MVESVDLLPNIAALFIAIKQDLDNPETAIKIAEKALDNPFNEVQRRYVRRNNLTEDDVRNMIKLRERKVKYKDIGVMYGLSDKAVYSRIRHYKKKYGIK